MDTDNRYDVIIIGAGISGINTAYRLQSQIPDYSYTILEGRHSLGGTWDLFQYPGIRSDSDLHTFGFPWRPWPKENAIADGPSIKKYMTESAEQHGIDRHIQYHKKLIAADWSSKTQSWALKVDAEGEKQIFHARFLVLGTGYYDYNNPLPAVIPGIENFKGKVIHPQFWPKDLDYSGKKIIIIGSGATAVTLLPNLVEKAAHVTMLQRSPSYIASRPTSDALETFIRKWFPIRLGLKLARWKNLAVSFLLFQWCRAYPLKARNMLKKATIQQLPKTIPHDPHFEPTYNPWEQRLCLCPNGDFFDALRAGNSDVVTGKIKTMSDNRIILESGKELDADIIVTATGLKMQLAGGAMFSVDGQSMDPGSKFIWKSALIQDVPNMFFIIGYTNASWTLGADATALLICRLLKNMRSRKMTSVVPRVKDGEQLKPAPLLNLSSTYIKLGGSNLPKAAEQAPWRARSNYFIDWYNAKFGDIKTGLEYSKGTSETLEHFGDSLRKSKVL
jgi:cation diffusion facilitator CzcD-associated flavoprotein CzcO